MACRIPAWRKYPEVSAVMAVLPTPTGPVIRRTGTIRRSVSGDDAEFAPSCLQERGAGI